METWSTQKLAEALQLTPRRINQLVQERILLPPTKAGRFDPFTAVSQYCKFIKGELESEELSQARAAHLRLITKVKALAYAKGLNEVHDVNACWRKLKTYRDRVNEHYEQLPARMFGDLAAEAASLAAKYGKDLIPTADTCKRMIDVLTIEAASLREHNSVEFTDIFGKEVSHATQDNTQADQAATTTPQTRSPARRKPLVAQ